MSGVHSLDRLDVAGQLGKQPMDESPTPTTRQPTGRPRICTPFFCAVGTLAGTPAVRARGVRGSPFLCAPFSLCRGKKDEDEGHQDERRSGKQADMEAPAVDDDAAPQLKGDDAAQGDEVDDGEQGGADVRRYEPMRPADQQGGERPVAHGEQGYPADPQRVTRRPAIKHVRADNPR